ncbi:MAG: right-handed parallel beta-helix repeat-containing protein [Candidatus Wallbacteria bacterium]|nr:right-handed parallel beta-helix repeat-containing protein [Candidatus Wallbacteria bacterium]
MNRNVRWVCRVVAILSLAGASSIASAQASRTWVSGVGDDVNPCSRTAPCKTFAGAISKTAVNGEISVLDPGGFGAVTVTKSITLNSQGSIAGILAAGVNGVVVSAAGGIVILRGLDIDGINSGTNGIRVIDCSALYVENCTIGRFTNYGIDFEPSGQASLFVVDTVIRSCGGAAGGGILIKPTTSCVVSITRTSLDKNRVGVRAEDGATVHLTDSRVTSSASNGIVALGATRAMVVNVDRCIVSSNGNHGILAQNLKGLVRLSNSSVMDNTANGVLAQTGGDVLTFQNNRINGNAVDGTVDITSSK